MCSSSSWILLLSSGSALAVAATAIGSFSRAAAGSAVWHAPASSATDVDTASVGAAAAVAAAAGTRAASVFSKSLIGLRARESKEAIVNSSVHGL
jgi:hypothetical protein